MVEAAAGEKHCLPLPSGGRAWPPLIDCYGPWHWDLALARVPPALSVSQDARNSWEIPNTVSENEPRTLSLALSLALSRARALSLSLTNTHTHTHTRTHTHTHTHTGGVTHMRLLRGKCGTVGETICVCAQGNLWVTDQAELECITFPQHVCFVFKTDGVWFVRCNVAASLTRLMLACFQCGTRTLSWIEPKNWWRRQLISMQNTLLQSLTGVAQLKTERRQEDDSVNW